MQNPGRLRRTPPSKTSTMATIAFGACWLLVVVPAGVNAQTKAAQPRAAQNNKAPAAAPKPAAKTAAAKPTTAPAKADIDPKDTAELTAINHKLTADATAALEAGKLDAARTSIDDAAKQLNAFVERTKVPQWHRNVASLYQLVDRKNTTLAQKLKAAGKPVDAPAHAKIPTADLKEIAEARKNLAQVKRMLVSGDVENAKKAVEDADAVLTKAVADSGAPVWHEALAPAFQALDLQQAAVKEELKALKEEALVKADAAEEEDSKALKVGDRAPAFTAQTVDGKAFNSKSLAGKWVLVDFWATWCGPCKAEIPNLREIHETFGKDSRFVLLSLSIDDQIDKPREFTKDNNMKWTQGFLGKGWKAPLLQQYGIHGIPAIYLIDPNGKIAAKGLRGERIKQVVGTVLQEKTGT